MDRRRAMLGAAATAYPNARITEYTKRTAAARDGSPAAPSWGTHGPASGSHCVGALVAPRFPEVALYCR